MGSLSTDLGRVSQEEVKATASGMCRRWKAKPTTDKRNKDF